ncbi:hypothetical protein ANN_17487 [Periplaneta americana]|uniref:Uncharacterized protein n=1 Tax=Periplaneta americana TaxID=6978 RepID=A0ABQ8SUA5_PERAM|nr:hypothetical protein ANN_17487 [Periplaneta americana]
MPRPCETHALGKEAEDVQGEGGRTCSGERLERSGREQRGTGRHGKDWKKLRTLCKLNCMQIRRIREINTGPTKIYEDGTAMEWNGISGGRHYDPALRPFKIYRANPQARRIPKPTPADYTKFRCVHRFRAGNPIRPRASPLRASSAGAARDSMNATG